MCGEASGKAGVPAVLILLTASPAQLCVSGGTGLLGAQSGNAFFFL